MRPAPAFTPAAALPAQTIPRKPEAPATTSATPADSAAAGGSFKPRSFADLLREKRARESAAETSEPPAKIIKTADTKTGDAAAASNPGASLDDTAKVPLFLALSICV